MEDPVLGRPWPRFAPILFGVTLLVYAAGVPLGLSRVDGAFTLASSFDLDTAGLDHGAAPVLLWIRLLSYLPIGDLAFRGNLASIVLAALAVALIGSMCLELLVRLRPSREARQQSHDFIHEPIAAVGAALVSAVALSSFDSAVSLGLTSATLLVVVVGWRCLLALLLGAESAAWALLLAAVCGLSSSVLPVAGPILWPSLIWMAFWALRRGQRWPILVPVSFLAAFAVGGLSTLAASSVPITFSRWIAAFVPATGHGVGHFPAVLVYVADELGVIGSILFVMGVGVFLSRHALLGIWHLVSLFTALLFCPDNPASGTEGARAAMALVLFLAAFGIAGGIHHVALRMGRAKSAAAFALAMIAVVSPAFDGGLTRWRPRNPLPMRLMEEGLRRAGPRSSVDPGSVEMAGLFRLARTVGLRPDLDITLPQK